LFSKARQSCIWNTPQSLRQTENECGARTLWSMVSICNHLSTSDDMETAILLATLNQQDRDGYNSVIIRRKVAALMKVSEATKERYEAAIAEMRRWLKRQESRRNGDSSQRTGEPLENIINLC